MIDPDRFWNKVSVKGPEACWEWQAYRDASGYGRVRLSGPARVNRNAHRVSYMLAHNRWDLRREQVVAHKCDNRGCVNPAHLFLCTQVENIQDMCRKGRNVTRVSDETVAEIKAAEGFQWQIASRFNVDQSYVSALKRGYLRAHVPPKAVSS